MNQEEFVNAVLLRMRPQSSWHEDSKNEEFLEFCKNDIRQYFKKNWSVEDTASLLNCMEEYNPYLREDIALERMKKISDKYENGVFQK